MVTQINLSKLLNKVNLVDITIVDISTIEIIYYFSSMEKLNSVFFYQLERSIKTYRQFAQQNFKQHGFDITIDQWLVLKALTDHPDITQNDLADMVFKDKASITRIIDLLVKNDFLNRAIHDESRRRNKLTITNKGKKIIEGIVPVVLNNRKMALSNICEEDLEIAERVLKSIIENCHTT